MKLSVLQENLQSAVNTVSRLISTNTSLPILSTILLRSQKGMLELQATNLEMAISYKIGARIEKSGSLSVPARLLHDLVTTLPNDKLQLSSVKDNLEIHTAQANTLINSMSATDFPKIPDVKTKNHITLKTNTLIRALEYVLPSISLDESRPVLTGVVWKLDKKDLLLAATDSYRLSQTHLVSKSSEGLEVIVPSRVLSELVRIVRSEKIDEVSVGFSDNEVVFSTEHIQLTSQLIEGKYPDYTKILPSASTTTVEIDTHELANNLKIASLFSRENAHTISLNIQKNNLTIDSDGSGLGKNTSQISCKTTGDSQSINLNARYLLDAINQISSNTLFIRLNGPLEPCMLSSDSKTLQEFQIIMPLRS